MEGSAQTNEKKIIWSKMVIQPLIYGALGGVGMYAALLVIKSPIGNELLAVAKEEIKNKK